MSLLHCPLLSFSQSHVRLSFTRCFVTSSLVQAHCPSCPTTITICLSSLASIFLFSLSRIMRSVHMSVPTCGLHHCLALPPHQLVVPLSLPLITPWRPFLPFSLMSSPHPPGHFRMSLLSPLHLILRGNWQHETHFLSASPLSLSFVHLGQQLSSSSCLSPRPLTSCLSPRPLTSCLSMFTPDHLRFYHDYGWYAEAALPRAWRYSGRALARQGERG